MNDGLWIVALAQFWGWTWRREAVEGERVCSILRTQASNAPALRLHWNARVAILGGQEQQAPALHTATCSMIPGGPCLIHVLCRGTLGAKNVIGGTFSR